MYAMSEPKAAESVAEVAAMVRLLAAALPPTNAAEAALYARLFAALEALPSDPP
jgi:hypothetical protein